MNNSLAAKVYCMEHPAVAYYSGFSGVEIHGIEYGIDDYVYAVSGAWGSESIRSYHRAKVYYKTNGDAYFMLHGHRIPLSECIRMA